MLDFFKKKKTKYTKSMMDWVGFYNYSENNNKKGDYRNINLKIFKLASIPHESSSWCNA
jgi:hypothetical protein